MRAAESHRRQRAPPQAAGKQGLVTESGQSALLTAGSSQQGKVCGKQAVEIPPSPGCEFSFLLLQLHDLGFST